MIKVEIAKEVEVIKQVTVDGHADYAETWFGYSFVQVFLLLYSV